MASAERTRKINATSLSKEVFHPKHLIALGNEVANTLARPTEPGTNGRLHLSDAAPRLAIAELESKPESSTQPHKLRATLVRSINEAATVVDNSTAEEKYKKKKALYTTDSIALYKRNMDAYPILPMQEQKKLGWDVYNGMQAADELRNGNNLAAARAQELQLIVRSATEARHKLIIHNWRAIFKIAHKYRDNGVPLLDLVQEGNLGFDQGLDKYDPNTGFAVLTYALWWVRARIREASLEQSKPILVKRKMQETHRNLTRDLGKLEEHLGHYPSEAEIQKHLGIKPERVREIMQAAPRIISTEDPHANGSDNTVGDMLVDTDARNDPNADLTTRERDADLEYILEALDLNERESEVLKLRFGWTEDPLSRPKIAERVGVSTSRVGQIEAEALGKIRRNKGAMKRLEVYRN